MTRLAALVLLAAPALAQPVPITPEDYLGRTANRSVEFRYPDGTLLGTERFGPGGVTWRWPDSPCYHATITVEGPLVCFHTPEFPERNCWQPFAEDGALLMRPEGPFQPFFTVEETKDHQCPAPLTS